MFIIKFHRQFLRLRFSDSENRWGDEDGCAGRTQNVCKE